METIQKKTYEITFHVLDEDSSKVSEIIKNNNGEIIEERPFRKVALSYPIDKQRYTFLGIIKFSIDAKFLDNLYNELKLSKATVRYLVSVVSDRKDKNKRERKLNSEKNLSHPAKIKSFDKTLTNEALEKKIEEILQ